MIRKLDYMLIGASKCATSSICSLLGAHPNVFMTTPKEPHFFSKDENYNCGFDWYESLFKSAKEEEILGEGSNTYTMKEVFPDALRRILEYAPDIKIIYCVRDPIPRIESYWMEMRTHGGEDVHYDFNKAVQVNRDWLVDSANYWQQISLYREFFPDEKIHVIFFEDFKKNPGLVMHDCFQFLGVDPSKPLAKDDNHLGQTEGRLAPKESFSKIRSNPVYKAAVKFLPTDLRKSFRNKYLFKPLEGRPQWDPKVKEWVADVLGEDSHKFLEFYGKPKDFWRLRN